MIILDTNVVSEPLKAQPSETVLRWMDAQASIFTTAVTQAEILYGIERLPESKRKLRLLIEATQMFAEDFRGRILPFDADAAAWYGKLVAARELAGRPIAQLDGIIAAITRGHRATLATRNTAHFEHCGIDLLNPWLK